MLKNKSKFLVSLLSIVFICLFQSLNGQNKLDATLELKNIGKVISNQNMVFSNFKIKVFKTHVSIKALETTNGILVKNGSSYYYKLGPTEIITNNTHYIYIDSLSKKIYVREFSKKLLNERKTSAYIHPNFDSISKVVPNCSVKIYSQNSNIIIIPFEKNSQFEKIEIIYDTKTYLPIKYIYYSSQKIDFNTWKENIGDKPRTEVALETNLNPSSYVLSLLESNKYIKKNKKSNVANGKYLSYSVINFKK